MPLSPQRTLHSLPLPFFNHNRETTLHARALTFITKKNHGFRCPYFCHKKRTMHSIDLTFVLTKGAKTRKTLTRKQKAGMITGIFSGRSMNFLSNRSCKNKRQILKITIYSFWASPQRRCTSVKVVELKVFDISRWCCHQWWEIMTFQLCQLFITTMMTFNIHQNDDDIPIVRPDIFWWKSQATPDPWRRSKQGWGCLDWITAF